MLQLSFTFYTGSDWVCFLVSVVCVEGEVPQPPCRAVPGAGVVSARGRSSPGPRPALPRPGEASGPPQGVQPLQGPASTRSADHHTSPSTS